MLSRCSSNNVALLLLAVLLGLPAAAKGALPAVTKGALLASAVGSCSTAAGQLPRSDLKTISYCNSNAHASVRMSAFVLLRPALQRW
jgi:hypothetical protein